MSGVEKTAQLVKFLHDNGYRYGQGLGKITPQELEVLSLGVLVGKKQSEQRRSNQRRKYTEPEQSLDDAMAEYERKHDL